MTLSSHPESFRLPPIEELVLDFDPTAARAKVSKRRRQLRGRVVSLVLTVAILAALYFWQRDELSGRSFVTLYSVLIGISLAWLLGQLIAYVKAKRALAQVGTGTALRIGRAGVELRAVFVPWAQVQSLAAVSPGWGRAELLRLTPLEGPPVTVPLDQLDVRPATLDTTARAYSAGRHGVDLQALDS
jgi:hypothetical protein